MFLQIFKINIGKINQNFFSSNLMKLSLFENISEIKLRN